MSTFANFLPFEYRRRCLLRRRFLQWALVWAACVLAAAGLWAVKQAHYASSLRALEVAEHRYAPLQRLLTEREDMQKQLRLLHAEGTVMRQLRDERPLLTLIGAATKSARECNGRLFIHRMLFKRNEERPQSDDRTPDTPATGRKEPDVENAETWASVAFTGKALDNIAVARFVVGLRDSGLFRRVELKSSVGHKQSANPSVRSYVLECDI